MNLPQGSLAAAVSHQRQPALKHVSRDGNERKQRQSDTAQQRVFSNSLVDDVQAYNLSQAQHGNSAETSRSVSAWKGTAMNGAS